jgi:hypothetical protein
MPRENLDISDLDDIAAEYLTRLTQHRDVILTVLFKHSSVVKDLVFLLVIPCYEFSSFRHAQFINAVLTDIWNRSYIIEIRLCIEIIRITTIYAQRARMLRVAYAKASGGMIHCR